MALKYSRQRELIKDFLRERRDHPTADTVYKNVRQQNPNISLGTVYRNLALLADRGEILRLRLGDGTDHFDADISLHYHFICNNCGCVQDLPADDVENLPSVTSRHFRGQITGHMIYFCGLCEQCCQGGED